MRLPISAAAVLFFLPVLGLPAMLQDSAELQAKARALMVGKVAILQRFYTSNDLHFDSSGHLLGSSSTGAWTSYGGVEIDSFKLGSHSIVITGKRNVRRWEGDELTNYTLDKPVRIEIDVHPEITERELVAALESVFLFRAQRLSDIVPDYWKDFLTTERNRSAAWAKKETELRMGVKAATPPVIPPKLLSNSGGINLSTTPPKATDDNTLTTSFVVDQKGQVRDVQIMKPVGLGVDDSIAENVSRWKFDPALSGSKPVPVLMYGRVEIKFPSGGHIDPYHTNECPNLPNVYAC